MVRTSAITAGAQAFGPDFQHKSSEGLGRERDYAEISHVMIRPSEDLGKIAADVVRATGLAKTSGVMARFIRRAVEEPLDVVGDHQHRVHLDLDVGQAASLSGLKPQGCRGRGLEAILASWPSWPILAHVCASWPSGCTKMAISGTFLAPN